MPDRVQPGARIDEAVWDEFCEKVEERCGGRRGHLRNELEKLLLSYNRQDSPNDIDIERRLERIENAVGAVPTDGGASASEPEHTHTDESTNDTLSERPRAKASREKKRQWLIQSGEDRWDGEPDLIREADVIDLVKSEYQFRSDTCRSYVEDLLEHWGLVDHPQADSLLVQPETRREMIRKETEDEFDDLDESQEVANDD